MGKKGGKTKTKVPKQERLVDDITKESNNLVTSNTWETYSHSLYNNLYTYSTIPNNYFTNFEFTNSDINKSILEAEQEKDHITLYDDPSIIALLNDPTIGNYIQRLKGQGAFLPSDLLNSLGFHSLPNVKVHTDDMAIFLCEMMNARAFAYGNDIFFNENEFNSDSNEGRQLLVHELAHVDKQTNEGNSKVQRQVLKKVKNKLSNWGKSIAMIYREGGLIGDFILAMARVDRKINISNLDLSEVQKGTGGSLIGIKFGDASKIPNNIKPKEGEPKPGTLDLNLDLKNGTFHVGTSFLPIESINYPMDGMTFSSDTMTFEGFNLDMAWDGNKDRKLNDPVYTSKFEAHLKKAVLKNLRINFNNSELYVIDSVTLGGVDLIIANYLLGLNKELNGVIGFNTVFLNVLTDLSKFVSFAVLQNVDNIFAKEEKPYEEKLAGLMQRQQFGESMNTTFNIKEGLIIEGIHVFENGNFSSPVYTIGKIESQTAEVTVKANPANEKISDEKLTEILEAKRKLKSQQAKWDKLREKEIKGKHVTSRLQKANSKIDEYNKEVNRLTGTNEMDNQYSLTFDTTGLSVSGYDSVIKKYMPTGMVDGEITGAPVTASSMKIETSFGQGKTTLDNFELNNLNIPDFSIAGKVSYESEDKTLKFFIQQLQLVGTHADIKLNKKNDEYYFEKIKLKVDEVKAGSAGAIAAGKEFKFNNGSIKLLAVALDISEDKIQNASIENINAPGLEIPGILDKTDQMEASGLYFELLDDGRYKYGLKDLGIMTSYQAGANNAKVAVERTSISGIYDPINDNIFTSVNIPVMKSGPIFIASEDGLSYINMPTGGAQLTNVGAEICIMLRRKNENEQTDDKPFFEHIEITKLHADSLRSNGLQAKLQTAAGSTPIQISFPSDKEGVLKNINIQQIDITEKGLQNIKNAQITSSQIPGLELAMGQNFSGGGNLHTGNITYNYENGANILSIKDAQFNNGKVQAGNAFNASGNISASDLSYNDINGETNVVAENVKASNANLQIGNDLSAAGNLAVDNLTYNTQSGNQIVKATNATVNGGKLIIGEDGSVITGNIAANQISYNYLKDGSQEITIDGAALAKGHILLPASEEDKKAKKAQDFNLDSNVLNIQNIIVHISKEGKIDLFANNTTIKNINFVLASESYTMDLFLPGRTSLKEVEKVSFGSELASAWEIVPENTVEVKNITLTTTRFNINNDEPDSEVELLKQKQSAQKYWDKEFNREIQELNTNGSIAPETVPGEVKMYIIDYNQYLYPDKYTDIIGSPGYLIYKERGPEGLWDEVNRIRETQQNLIPIDAIDSSDGLITLTMFGQEISAPINEGGIYLQSLLNNEVADAAANYIRSQDLDFLYEEKVRKITSELDAKIALYDLRKTYSNSFIHNISLLINGIQDNEGKESLANFANYLLKNTSINSNENPSKILISDLDAPPISFVDQKYINNDIVSIKGIMEYQLKNNIRSNEDALSDIARSIQVKGLTFDQFLNELDKKLQDDWFYTTYMDDIIPFITSWFKMYAFSLVSNQIQTFGLELHNIQMKPIADYFNTLEMGHLTFNEHDRYNGVFDISKAPGAIKIGADSNKENINLEYFNIPGFTYINPTNSFKLTTERMLGNKFNINRTEKLTSISSSEGISFVNLKLYVKK